jgi:hypothetical protein
MREKPMRVFEDLRAKSVGGRSIRKRLARSSSIASTLIIALRILKYIFLSNKHSLFPREQPPSRTEKVQRLMPEKQGRVVSVVICRGDFSGESYKTGKFVQFLGRFERINSKGAEKGSGVRD